MHLKNWCFHDKSPSYWGSPMTQELHQEMGQEMGKVADDLAPFQNKNLSPQQQAAVAQLMSNKARF